MIDFCLLYVEGKPLEFRSRGPAARQFYDEHPAISTVVRSMFGIYRKENVDACAVIAIARDLEHALRTMTGTREIVVMPMRYVTRDAGILLNTETGETTPFRKMELTEITDERPTAPASR